MSNPTEVPDLDKLEALAKAATPQNFDSAQITNHGCIECPSCDGSGEVELTADYCNYDGRAIGVQFYGIGPEHRAAEAFYRAANPAAVLALVAAARRAQPEGEAPQAVAQVQLNGDSWMDVAANELPTWERKRFKARTLYTAPAAQHAESVAPAPDAERVDAIVTGLYHRFKGWSKRGFSADDVTWCEVKADVIALIAAQSQGAQTAYEELLQAARDLRGELVVANALIERRTRERDEALAAQQAAAPGALDDGDDRMWDTNTVMSYVISLPGAIDRTRAENVDDVLNALILMRRELPAPSAPGTPEAPKGGAA